MARPAAVAFDVIGTLMDLEPLRVQLTDIGQPPHLLEQWYARTIRDGMALSATGDYADFPDVAASALREITGYAVTDAQVAKMLSGISSLSAFPDALPACERLHAAGIRVALLTNGAPRPATAFVSRSGLEPYVDRVISIREVQRWKPWAIVYRYAAEVLGVDPANLALVAAHSWDVHGAKRAGLRTAYVNRQVPTALGAPATPAAGGAGVTPGASGAGVTPGAGRFPAIFAPPDVSAPDLVAAVEALLGDHG
jgi:2-haloacid dehalogenase